MAITHKKIAELAGVSRSLVSMALNDSPAVDVNTKKRITKLAEELGYRPNLLIRGIQTGKTKTIGIVLRAQRKFFGDMLSGIELHLEDRDYLPITLSSRESITTAILRLVDQRVDGIIFKPEYQLDKDELKLIHDLKIPVVTVDNMLNQNVSFSGSDEELIGKIAAQHLINYGHKKIAVVSVKEQFHISVRVKSFVNTALDAGLDAPLVYELESFEEEVDYGKLFKDSGVTGVFFVSDNLAGDFLNYANKVGIKVPEDISILGTANMELGEYTSPNLTTIDQNPYQIGVEAAKLLLEKIESSDIAHYAYYKQVPELIIRDSTQIIGR